MKKLGLLLSAFVALVALTGCVQEPSTVEGSTIKEPEAIQSYEKLKDVKSFTMKKKVWSWHASYIMETDNSDTYEFNGKTFYIGGNTVKMTDKHGKLIATDQQLSRNYNFAINRMAEITDENGNITGFIGEKSSDLFSWTKRYTIFDKNGTEVASGVQKFKFNTVFEITTNDGTLAYKIEGAMLSWSAEYTIEVLDNSVVPVEYAAIFTIIGNEVKEAQTKKASNMNK